MSGGKCVGDAPAAFAYDADELAELIPEGVSTLDDAALLRIARNCPGQAIFLFDSDGAPVEL